MAAAAGYIIPGGTGCLSDREMIYLHYIIDIITHQIT